MKFKTTHLSLIILCILTSVIGYSQNPRIPNNRFFYEQQPTSGTRNFNEIASETGMQTSRRLQNLIDEVSELRGTRPVIRINSGTYRLNGIEMKSNVHIRVNRNVIIKVVLGSRNSNIFETADNAVRNFSITGVNGRFTFDLRELEASKRVRAFAFTDIRNFKISNIRILDSNTIFSSLAFLLTGNSIPSVENVIDGLRNGSITRKPVLVEDPSNPIRVPTKGIIENITATNANYGYGSIQVQAGQNLLFRNIETTGGVGLRLETGINRMQILENLVPPLNEIYGVDLTATNGQAAVTLSPHTLKHRKIVLKDITATSCEYGVALERGFVSSNATGRPQQNNPILALTPGRFSNATITNITVTFGQNAQLRSTRLRYIPCELRVARNSANTRGIRKLPANSGASFRGPSLIPVSNEASHRGPGGYIVTFNNLTFSGYSSTIASDGTLTGGESDFEICDEEVSGINFFVPRRDRITPNPLNGEFCAVTNADGTCRRLGRNAPANQLIANGTYHINSPVSNNRLVDTNDSNRNVKSQGADRNSNRARWIFNHLGNDVYTIRNLGTNRFLEVPFAECENGTNVATTGGSGRNHQRWKVIRNNNDYALVPNHCTNRALDRSRGALNTNAQIWIFRRTNRNQRWKIDSATNAAPLRFSTSELLENNVDTSVKLYPNPSSDFVTLNNASIGSYISISNTLGKVVKELTTTVKNEQLPISDLDKGLYFITINNDKTFKFIKN